MGIKIERERVLIDRHTIELIKLNVAEEKSSMDVKVNIVKRVVECSQSLENEIMLKEYT
jgi:hypothetical protein